MAGLRILMTSCSMDYPEGAPLYTHDVARELLARGHQPLVYSPRLGVVSERLSVATIGTVNDLAAVHFQPDIIHAQQSLETLKALLHFPRTPAIYVCHDWNAPHDIPPRFPRIGRYVAVDDTVRDRLVLMEGIAEREIDVICNGVNLQRFRPRPPLPERPRRALAISNYMHPVHVEIIRQACRQHELELDTAGLAIGGSHPQPEELLRQYDLVFAKGRCAWEALAVGAAVILCEHIGVGPMVTSGELAQLRRANFGRRLMRRPLRPETIAEQISRYNAQDAALVSLHIRATSGVETTVDQLLAVYDEVITAYRAAPPDPADDMRTAARFLETWPGFKSPPPPSPATTCTTIVHTLGRQILREELQQALRPTGLRKLARSIRKRVKNFTPWRGAA